MKLETIAQKPSLVTANRLAKLALILPNRNNRTYTRSLQRITRALLCLDGEWEPLSYVSRTGKLRSSRGFRA